MTRLLLTWLLPLLAPTLAYLAWFWWRARVVRANGGTPPAIERGPWVWLIGAGAVLTLAVLGVGALTRGAPSDAVYVPPVKVDGRIVPGHFE
ncbi:hypothetical protein [Roseospirillum parvum]|uniref:Uncharacterized protein n=1 Tax=Roseospirillum parvum TaxID=83401 RepID=A0A1G7ZQX8_9PROT|nr:hypothetical protein [Roseospirillum parvum]SDH11113.1 hypothetical protein SAMN05421742_104191 [Roseospirillum parvum]